MNKKSLVGVGVGIAVAIAVLIGLSSANLAPSMKETPSNGTNGGLPSQAVSPIQSTNTAPAKRSYSLELNETVGIATK